MSRRLSSRQPLLTYTHTTFVILAHLPSILLSFARYKSTHHPFGFTSHRKYCSLYTFLPPFSLLTSNPDHCAILSHLISYSFTLIELNHNKALKVNYDSLFAFPHHPCNLPLSRLYPSLVHSASGSHSYYTTLLAYGTLQLLRPAVIIKSAN